MEKMLLVAFCSKPHWLFVCKPALNGFCFKLGWLLQCKPAWLLPCKLDWLLILALASLAFCSIGSPACMALNLQALEGFCFIYANHVCTSSTAQGGGGSFKNRKPIGEVGCCESGMAERSH